MATNSQRLDLNDEFENLGLQVQEVKTLLKAVIHQHDTVYLLGDQLAGIARLLDMTHTQLEVVQTKADELAAWAEVNYRRSMGVEK